MAAKSSGSPKKKKSLLDQLMALTKSALYSLAQSLNIPKRSEMTKPQLIEALARETVKVKKLLASSLLKTKPSPTDTKEKETRSKKTTQPKKTEAKTAPPKAQAKVSKPKAAAKRSSHKAVEAKSTKARSSGKTTTKSNRKNSVAPAVAVEPVSPVWQGHEGPELPQSYGETVLHAMPKNPHTAYVYWDIDEKTCEAFERETSEFEAVLRIYGQSEIPDTEIEIELGAHQCYVELTPDHTYAFEIGIKSGNGYRTIVRSNLMTLPPDTSSYYTQAEQDAVLSGASQDQSSPGTGAGSPSSPFKK